MDVYALQALLQREGWLDRIDLVLDSSANAAEVKTTVTAKVRGIATVRQPDPGNQLAGAAISTLRFVANVIALVGVLVSALLCYAAMAASVDRRTRLFALFRAAGLEATRIHRLVHVDSLAVGIAGVVVGTPLGLWLSRTFAAVFSQTSSWLSGLEIKPAPISPTVLLLGAGVGIGVSQVSAVLAVAQVDTGWLRMKRSPAGAGWLRARRANPRALALRSAALLSALWLVAWKAPLPIPGTYRAACSVRAGNRAPVDGRRPSPGALLPLLRAGSSRIIRESAGVAVGSLALMRLNQTRIATASIAALIGHDYRAFGF